MFENSDNDIKLGVKFNEMFKPAEVESFKVSVIQDFPTVIQVLDLTDSLNRMSQNYITAEILLKEVYKKAPNGGLMNVVFTMHLKDGRDNLQSKRIFLKPLNTIQNLQLISDWNNPPPG